MSFLLNVLSIVMSMYKEEDVHVSIVKLRIYLDIFTGRKYSKTNCTIQTL
jgi:hypothetical protein